jgi:hypothetical protein
LVLQSELYQQTLLMSVLDTVDTVFLGIFMLEALLKIVAFGFVATGPRAYLRDSWNIFDLAIVILGYSCFC